MISRRSTRPWFVVCIALAGFAHGLALSQSPPPAAAAGTASGGGLGLRQLWSSTPSAGGLIELPPGPTDTPEAATAAPLSLEAALDQAREYSFALGVAGAKAQSATELARAAWSGVLPTVDLRAARGREVSTPSSRLGSDGLPLASSTQQRTEAYAVLSQPLLDLAAVAEIRRAGAVREAAASDAQGARGDLHYEATAAFFTLAEAALVHGLAVTQRQRLEKLGDYVAARAEAGGASGADRERIRARVLAARSAVQDAAAQLNQARIALQRLTRSDARKLALPPVDGSAATASLQQLQAMVADGNAAVLTARANEDAARHEWRGQVARFTPVLKFELSDNKVKNSGGLMGWKEDRRAMLVLSMPLFSGGADFFRQRALAARQSQFAFERLEAERTAQQALEVAYAGLTAARQRIESLREQAAAQARVVQAFDAQLASSTRSLLDVFDAYQQDHQSRVDLVRTSVQAVLLEQQVLRLTGQLGRSADAGE